MAEKRPQKKTIYKGKGRPRKTDIRIESNPTISRQSGVDKINEFEEYALYLALPREERMILFKGHTDAFFSRKYKVNKSTLTEWKKKEELWKLRNSHLKILKQYTIDVLRGLRNKAIQKGDAAEVKLWMQLIEEWVEKEKLKVEHGPQRHIIITRGEGSDSDQASENRPVSGANNAVAPESDKGVE